MGFAQINLAPRYTYRIRKRDGLWQLWHVHVFPHNNCWWDHRIATKARFSDQWIAVPGIYDYFHCNARFTGGPGG